MPSDAPRTSTLAGMAASGFAAGFFWTRRWLSGTSFAGKVVLITGGSRGLGLVLAREFTRLGARVAICARDELELERAREELSRRGEVFAIPCDITDRAQAEEV